MDKEFIDISGQERYYSEDFRKTAMDCLSLIFDLMRTGGDVPAQEIANRAYFLQWLVEYVEIRDGRK